MAPDRKIGADTPAKNVGNMGKGRPKGAPNKLTKTIKEAIEVAFDKAGGADYLARMANEQPAAFMTLLGKVLPTQVDASVKGIGMPVIQIGVAPE